MLSSGLFLSLAFSIGFIFESIFGFGGGVISYSILGFFFDIKSIVMVGLYIGTITAIVIVITGYKNINIKIVKNTILYIILGIFLGVVFFKILPSKILIRIYSITLIIISTRALFFSELKIKEKYTKYFLFLGGIIQGALGVGGPIFAIVLKTQNLNKTVLRSTLGLIFAICNVIRIIQLFITNVLKIDFFTTNWYIPLPVMFSLWFGYIIHKKIPQKSFDRYIYILIFTSAIAFLVFL